MTKLIKKAVIEATKFNDDAYRAHQFMSDSIHDLKMFIDGIKQKKSSCEISRKEAVVLIDDCLAKYEQIGLGIERTNSWLVAIKESI